MVKFFLKAGDSQVSDEFTPYLWGKQGLGTLVEAYVNTRHYGAGMNLLLLQVYVEGRFEVNGPPHVKVGNYSKVREETSAAFTIRREDFQDRSDQQRKDLLSAMVCQAVAAVQRKQAKKAPQYDFQALFERVVSATEKYRGG
jgi:hypothetical protein